MDVRIMRMQSQDHNDPIACLNKAMAFLTAVASSRFPTTNNQLRTSSNPRNQATIQDGRFKGKYIQGQARVVKCYNCQGEGHIARQCTQPKRPRNDAWYKEKAMLADAQEAGQILDEEKLAFLADLGIPADQTQTIIPHNVAFQTEDLDTPNSETYLNDMDNQSVHALQDFEQSPVMDFIDNEISSDSNIIPYSQYLQETQQATVQDTNLQAQQDSMILSMIEQISREKMIDSQMDDMIREKLALKEQIDSLEQNLSKQIKENESLFKTFTVFKNESKEKENKYMENEIDLEKKIKELDNIVYKVGQSAQTVHMLTKPQAFYDNTHKQALGYQNPFYLRKAQRIKPTLYDGAVISKTHVAMPVIDDEETLILEEESRSKMFEKAKDPEVIAKKISHKPIDYEKLNSIIEDFETLDVPSELPKVSLVNASLKKLKFNLTQFDSMVKKRTTPSALEEGEWGVFKDQFDSIKQTRVRHKEQRKEIVGNVVHIPSANTIAPGMFKLDLEPLPPRLLQNREVHITYLRNTQEQANILQELVKQAKAKQPLDGDLDLACKYAIRIQELLVYVQDTCPNAITPSTKKVAVTPMNNVKKVRFAKPLTSSSNIKQVESSNTSDSNTPVLSSIGVKCSTSNCRSKPPGNKKNDRTLQTPSRNKKNKVEALPRKVNKMNHVVKPVCDVDVKHSLSKANSKILYATSCALGKSKKSSHQPKAEDTNQEKLYLLHMDLCGPMHVASINEKSSIISLYAEAINTACYTQNRSLIRLRYNKTPYELMQDKKPDLSFFHVFGSLCYPTNNHEDLGKFDAKADIGIFVGYAPAKKAFRIYNRRAQIITETIHVTFDELTAIASEQFSLGPGLHYMTPVTSSTGLGSNHVS
ncbi:retrovirus-related pol polyprotein from transposon TNT 1-94 [Tanacetum coccineum]|uniref:Retrovirus-related pol polyprotein from transposon TNT 1-94 n=1 Tax=Tanacetum coccineum TaxID=301880 RepID=A0ABQ5IYQ6_9ASTR